MKDIKDKYEYYQYLKELLESNGIAADQYTGINYGLQFTISLNGEKYLIRVYESRKHGVRCDLSQIKNEKMRQYIEGLVQAGSSTGMPEGSDSVSSHKLATTGLIGTDESGKGDYFGPLVIAGVYADAEGRIKLKEIGAADSKTLSDARIEKLAGEIAVICRYSIVVIENSRYNELYGEFNNLNKLLAWGHARVIENLLESVNCSNVLADQFGSPQLIKNALMERGRQVNLEQRHRAEENEVVAAASILARNEYVRAMKRLSEEYAIEFPKGCSDIVTGTARDFVKSYGRERLKEVAKLHFVVSDKL